MDKLKHQGLKENGIVLNKQEEEYLSSRKIFTMCVDPDWEPFEKLDNNANHIGISADIINDFIKVGYTNKSNSN